MFQPGDVLKESYRVESLHASGGMAHVYKVEHLTLGVKRALKVLRAQYSRDEGCVARFRKEAQIMAQLRHPNIAEIHDCAVTEDGLIFLVMEWLDGEDLAQRMHREPRQTLAFVLALCREVGAALAASHEVGVIHRDLKPGNVFLLRGPRESAVDPMKPAIKVVDFGIARLLRSEVPGADLTRVGQVLGTPGYMAPEQIIEAIGPIGPQSDQFALAVIAYELLIGERLYVPEGQDVGALYAMAQRMMVGRLPPLPPEAERTVGLVLRRALRHRPAERFPSMAEFVAALTAPASVPPPTESAGTPWPITGQAPPAARPRKEWWRYRSAGLMGICLLAVLIGVWKYQFFTKRRGSVPDLEPSSHSYWQSQPRMALVRRIPTERSPAVPLPEPPASRPCPVGLDIRLRDDHLGNTLRERGQAALIRLCIDKLRLTPLIASSAEVVLLRSGSLLVDSAFPRGPARLFEHCLEQKFGGTTPPREVHIKAVRDRKACSSESNTWPARAR